ncbi:MAG: hypothetical protein ACOCQF_03000 [Halanaerobiaceae bacterium]
MQNFKIYATGQILQLKWKECKDDLNYIFVFNKENQASKFKNKLAKNFESACSPSRLEELITELNYETLINHKDLEIMEAANNNLPEIYKTALEENVRKIYLGVILP